MKTVTITEFRRNLFQLVDEALATGEPIEIRRKGGRVVVRGEGEAEDEGEAFRRAEMWRRFWASPPPPGWENLDLSYEEIQRASELSWTWDEEPELGG